MFHLDPVSFVGNPNRFKPLSECCREGNLDLQEPLHQQTVLNRRALATTVVGRADGASNNDVEHAEDVQN